MELHAWHLWSVAGILLLTLEVFTTGFVLAIFGVACFAAALAAAFGLSVGLQFLSFASASALLAFTLRPLLAHYGVTRQDTARTNVDALIGRQGRVVETLAPHQSGRVKVDGEDWLAVSLHEELIPAGQDVIVCGVEGCKLFVQPLRGEN